MCRLLLHIAKVQYELNILDDIVLNKLKVHCSNHSESKDFMEQCILIAENSAGQIKKNFISETLILKKKKRIRHYIETHQHRLIFLADTLFNEIYQQTKSIDFTQERPRSLIGLQEAIYFIIEDLLSFLKKEFPKFFNSNDQMPMRSKLNSVRLFKNMIEAINQLSNDKLNEIWNIATEPFIKFMKDDFPSISYNQLQYMEKLAHELSEIAKSCLSGFGDDIVRDKLMAYNYNSWRFFSYLTREIKEKTNNEESIAKQIEILSLYIKRINQLQTQNGLIYNSAQQPLKDMLNNWVIEELCFAEKKLMLSQSFGKETKDLIPTDFKIITEFSVAQLACYIRLMVEAGIVKNNNIKELIGFYAANMNTKKTSMISAESLRIKYYNIERSTISEVKGVIIKLLNHLNDQSFNKSSM